MLQAQLKVNAMSAQQQASQAQQTQQQQQAAVQARAQAQLALAARAAAVQKQREEEVDSVASSSSSPQASVHKSSPGGSGQKPSKGRGDKKASSSQRSTKLGKARRASVSAPLADANDEIMDLLNQCPWDDRLIYATRLFLGGNSLNGYLRATSAAQRYKRQRARQVQIAVNKKKEMAAVEEAMARGAAAADKAGSDSAAEADLSVTGGLSGLLGAASSNDAAAPAAPQPKSKKVCSMQTYVSSILRGYIVFKVGM